MGDLKVTDQSGNTYQDLDNDGVPDEPAPDLTVEGEDGGDDAALEANGTSYEDALEGAEEPKAEDDVAFVDGGDVDSDTEETRRPDQARAEDADEMDYQTALQEAEASVLDDILKQIANARNVRDLAKMLDHAETAPIVEPDPSVAEDIEQETEQKNADRERKEKEKNTQKILQFGLSGDAMETVRESMLKRARVWGQEGRLNEAQKKEMEVLLERANIYKRNKDQSKEIRRENFQNASDDFAMQQDAESDIRKKWNLLQGLGNKKDLSRFNNIALEARTGDDHLSADDLARQRAEHGENVIGEFTDKEIKSHRKNMQHQLRAEKREANETVKEARKNAAIEANKRKGAEQAVEARVAEDSPGKVPVEQVRAHIATSVLPSMIGKEIKGRKFTDEDAKAVLARLGQNADNMSGAINTGDGKSLHKALGLVQGKRREGESVKEFQERKQYGRAVVAGAFDMVTGGKSARAKAIAQQSLARASKLTQELTADGKLQPVAKTMQELQSDFASLTTVVADARFDADFAPGKTDTGLGSDSAARLQNTAGLAENKV